MNLNISYKKKKATGRGGPGPGTGEGPFSASEGGLSACKPGGAGHELELTPLAQLLDFLKSGPGLQGGKVLSKLVRNWAGSGISKNRRL